MSHLPQATRTRTSGMLSPQLPDLSTLHIGPRGRDTDSFASNDSSVTAISIFGAEHMMEKRTTSLFANVDLRISPNGTTAFDYQNDQGARVSPRKVEEMHWYTEQSGNMDEWILVKVSDSTYGSVVWIRFRPCASLGDVTYSSSLATPPNSALRATLIFENGIEYRNVVDTHSKVLKQCRGSPDTLDPARFAMIYCEKLSLEVGFGVGFCTPQDLCEIWPALPDCDRRLQAFYWYEQTDGSGVEFIVLHVVGSSNFSSTQNWWVRLERDGTSDMVRFSRSRDLVVTNGSTQTRQIVFQDGILFSQVIQVLRDIPTGFGFATEDCWYYASTLAHRLSIEVGDDFFECPTEDLFEIWSGERGAQLVVNRVQWFKGAEGDQDILILNVSATSNVGSGLWIRLGQDDLIGGLVDSACITRNRRRLLRSDPIMLADIVFNDLRFGKVMQTLKQINRKLEGMLSFNADQYSKSALTLQILTQMPDLECYWVEGSYVLLDASLPDTEF